MNSIINSQYALKENFGKFYIYFINWIRHWIQLTSSFPDVLPSVVCEYGDLNQGKALNSVKIGRQVRVAVAFEHTGNLMRQNAGDRQLWYSVFGKEIDGCSFMACLRCSTGNLTKEEQFVNVERH